MRRNPNLPEYAIASLFALAIVCLFVAALKRNEHNINVVKEEGAQFAELCMSKSDIQTCALYCSSLDTRRANGCTDRIIKELIDEK